MKKIYVVIGGTGEYSDYYEWLVKAFVNEEKAKELAKNAEQEGNRVVKQYNHYSDVPKGANKYDPYFDINYTGTQYRIDEVDLEEM